MEVEGYNKQINESESTYRDNNVIYYKMDGLIYPRICLSLQILSDAQVHSSNNTVQHSSFHIFHFLFNLKCQKSTWLLLDVSYMYITGWFFVLKSHTHTHQHKNVIMYIDFLQQDLQQQDRSTATSSHPVPNIFSSKLCTPAQRERNH